MIEKKPFLRPPIVSELDIKATAPGSQARFRVVMTENATGNETLVPVIILRGQDIHPIVGVTAAIHGNELNGIPVIHKLVSQVEQRGLLRGTVVAVPIINIPGYLRQQREFEDGVDLNRIMPGAENGNESKLYARRFVDRVLRHVEVLIDLHTASVGRVNSLYVRANMDDVGVAKLARLIAPQIILHSPDDDGTLRGAAADLGIRAVTVEVGDPQRFQEGFVQAARLGLEDVLTDLGMLEARETTAVRDIIECSRSEWMYTDRGGVLSVLPEVAERVEAGQPVAVLQNVWGDLVREYEAPQSGIVIGKSTNPAARAGSRILHLGIPAEGR